MIVRPMALLFGLAFLAAPSPAEPSRTDEALIRELLGEVPNTAPEAEDMADPSDAEPSEVELAAPVDSAAAERLLSKLQEAERKLASGETDAATRSVQSEVLAELDRLIKAAEEGRGGRSPTQEKDSAGTAEAEGQSQSRPAGQSNTGGNPANSAASGDPTGLPTQNRDAKADESSSRLPNSAEPGRLRGLHSDLVRDAWGHLPPRMRERLLNAGPDRFVPQYDPLVRDYFESLARPASPQ